MTTKSDGTEKEFIVDIGSLVTLLAPDKETIKDKTRLPVAEKYQVVNKNEVKFTVKVTVEAESRRIRKTLPMLITNENIKSHYMVWIGYDNLIGQYDISKRRRR